jgi:hypothetical protein
MLRLCRSRVFQSLPDDVLKLMYSGAASNAFKQARGSARI